MSNEASSIADLPPLIDLTDDCPDTMDCSSAEKSKTLNADDKNVMDIDEDDDEEGVNSMRSGRGKVMIEMIQCH